MTDEITNTSCQLSLEELKNMLNFMRWAVIARLALLRLKKSEIAENPVLVQEIVVNTLEEYPGEAGQSGPSD